MTEPDPTGPDPTGSRPAPAGDGRPVVCCDLDGVIWRGDTPITPAIAGVAALREAGLRVAFLSNNSSRPVADVAAKLTAMGVPADPTDVLTSAVAAGHLLGASLAAGARVMVCGGPGIVEAVLEAGLEPVTEEPCAAVVVGIAPDFTYDVLDRTARAVRNGARFIAANLDGTYPVHGDLLPGSGAIVAAVAVASGCEPEVAGKPAPPTVALVREVLGTTGVVVGDRPSSDGALADALGWPFALVLSGVTAAVAPPGGEAIPVPAPPFVGADLGALVPELLAAFG